MIKEVGGERRERKGWRVRNGRNEESRKRVRGEMKRNEQCWSNMRRRGGSQREIVRIKKRKE